MYLIDVIPIARGIGVEQLSYFSSTKLAPGLCVRVPVGRRVLPALVVAAHGVRDSKAYLRQLTHPLKKISGTDAHQFLLPETVCAAQRLADYFATTTGSVLAALVPSAVWCEPPALVPARSPNTTESTPLCEVQALQAPLINRCSVYRSMVREAFARTQSVFIVVPSRARGEALYAQLSRGIEEHAFFMHGRESATRKTTLWRNATVREHPCLVIGTGGFLALPRNDYGLFIVEDETDDAFVLPARPFIDMRVVVEELARAHGARLIRAGSLLRLETIAQLKTSGIETHSASTFHTDVTLRVSVEDMRTAVRRTNPTQTAYTMLFGEDARRLLQSAENTGAENTGGKMLLLCARRGLSPTVLCGDCGEMVRCAECQSQAVLHGKEGERVLLCHHCGAHSVAEDRCKHCGSWRLAMLGAASELVEQTLQSVHPGLQVVRVDSDSTPTYAAAARAVDDFFSGEGGVLVGTAMLLSHLRQSVENSVIVSLDALFSVPHFRINEQIVRAVLAVSEHTTGRVLVQTRVPKQDVWNYVTDSNLSHFYNSESAARNVLHYPPFTTLIKVSIAARSGTSGAEAQKLESLFADYAPHVYRGHVSTRHLLHVLLRLPRDNWPDSVLLEKLRSLPQNYEIAVDPIDLF